MNKKENKKIMSILTTITGIIAWGTALGAAIFLITRPVLQIEALVSVFGNDNPITRSYKAGSHILGTKEEAIFDNVFLAEYGLEEVPKKVTKAFYADNGRFCLVTPKMMNEMGGHNIWTKSNGYYTDGMYWKGKYTNFRMIFLNSNSDEMDITLIHELGHYIDDKCGNVSETEAFKKAYIREKDNFDFSAYEKSAEDEYFAEGYARYVTSPVMFKSCCPETYEIIKNAEDSI